MDLTTFDTNVIKFDGEGVVVHYVADWCPPCKDVSEILSTIPTQYGGKISYVEIDVTKSEDICAASGVESVPFVAYYRHNPKLEGGKKQQIVSTVNGAKLNSIVRNLRSLFGNGNDSRAAFATLDEYIASLINRDRIVTFITGTPSHPMCGFTGKLCRLLEEYKVEYTYYDIMADDELCERLKTYSNWPTYPQLYVGGKLIGGLDIILELEKEGELKETLGI